MPRYRFAGYAPVPDPENELVHPGDVREYDTEPEWGPWEPLDAPVAAPDGPRGAGDGVPPGELPEIAPEPPEAAAGDEQPAPEEAAEPSTAEGM
jgi:hypothetical protein